MRNRTRIALVFIVQLEFGPLGDGKDTSNGEGVLGDLVEATVIKQFAPEIRREHVTVNVEIAFQSEAIAIAPGEGFSRDKAKVGAVAVAQEHRQGHLEASCQFCDGTVLGGSVSAKRGKPSVSDAEGEGSCFRGIDVPEARAEKRPEIEIKIGSKLALDLAGVLVVVQFGNEEKAAAGIQI